MDARRDLDRSLVKGIAWTGGMKWLTQLLSWASTLVVARLLTPRDYGLVGMALLYLGFVQLVNELGLGAVLVQRPKLETDQIARIGGLAALLGVGWFGISTLVAIPLALFFKEPAVRGIVVVEGATFILRGLQVVPRGLLTRHLEFRALAWIDALEGVVLAAATLTLALCGLRYWSLVLGSVIGGLTTTVVLNVRQPHRIVWPSRLRSIAAEIRFGWRVLAGQVAWYTYDNADFAVVGRVLGSAALGAYSIGWQLANLPVERLSALVGRVAPAVFARVQQDGAELRRYVAGVTEGLSLLTFPAAAGMALLADEFVALVLGPHWHAAITPLRLLAIYGGLRSVATVPPQVILATGHPEKNMRFNLLMAAILPLLFFGAARRGASAVALAWVVGYPLLQVPTFLRYMLRLIEMPATQYLRSLWPAATSTGVMVLAVLALRQATPHGWPLLAAFALHVVAGVAVYTTALVLLHRGRVRVFRGLSRVLAG